MGLLPLSVPLAPIQSETYLSGGIPIPANLRKLPRLLRRRHDALTGTDLGGFMLCFWRSMPISG